MNTMPVNATLVERILIYMDKGDTVRAEALAQLGDYLEECFLWDVSFDPED